MKKTKVFLITGATGIGAETARVLAHIEPHQFMLSTLHAPDGEQLCAELHALGSEAEFLAGDLTDPKFAIDLVKTAVRCYGSIHGLFNVAGISGRRYGDGPVHKCTEDGWNRTLQTNLTTQYRMCRETVSVMLSQPVASGEIRGVILNMASILGIDPEPQHFDTVAYAASKGAIIGMSRSMAASYARSKIRVNAIAPGLTQTPMSSHAIENQSVLEFIVNKQPVTDGVLGVSAVANGCAYLLSDSSSAITGQTLIVDGGWSLS